MLHDPPPDREDRHQERSAPRRRRNDTVIVARLQADSPAHARPRAHDPPGRRRLVQRLRARDPRARQSVLQHRRSRHQVRGEPAPCGHAAGDRSRVEAHGDRAASAPTTRRPSRSSSSPSAIAAAPAASSARATRALGRVAQRDPGRRRGSGLPADAHRACCRASSPRSRPNRPAALARRIEHAWSRRSCMADATRNCFCCTSARRTVLRFVSCFAAIVAFASDTACTYALFFDVCSPGTPREASMAGAKWRSIAVR